MDTHEDGKNRVGIKIVVDLLNRLTGNKLKKYKPHQLVDIVIDHKQYLDAITDISKNSIYFKNEEANRPLFLKKKKNRAPINDKNRKSYNAVVKALLASYGIDLKIKSMKRLRLKKTSKTSKQPTYRPCIYTYSLCVNRQLINIIKYKHGIDTKVNGYPTIYNQYQ
jgi:hypothetical protein